MPKGYVLSLCDRTGNMVLPWAEDGYECWCLDIQHSISGWIAPDEYCANGGMIYRAKHDVTQPLELSPEFKGWDIVFAFPPCTHLAVSGARWFKPKGMDKLIEALTVVNACRKICEASGSPWMLENPVSTLSTYWREPDYRFDPCDFAGYLDDPQEDAYTKKTCLWTGGGFIMPAAKRVEAVDGSRMHRMGPSVDRADNRSVTPRGFAKAVWEANRG